VNDSVLGDSQQDFRDSLRRFFAARCDFDTRRALLKSARGSDADTWRQLAELGALGLPLPEEHGGLGGSAADAMLVMEEIGRGLVLEPYLPCVLLAGGLIAREGSEEQKAEWLPAIASGEKLLSFAHYEPGGRYEETRVATRAVPGGVGGAWTLTGRKTFVLAGANADAFVVSARVSGGERDADGIGLFLVRRDAPGVSVHEYRCHDGNRAAELTLHSVPGLRVSGPPAGEPETRKPGTEYAIQVANAALCAEALGAMDALLQITLAYLKSRKQFGVPIGSFQALQHRAADMLLQLEQARSMAELAAEALVLDDAAERRMRISAAKTLVGQAARFVGQQAVQLHGGIGVTDELNVSHYFRRLTLIAASFGDVDHHLGIVSEGLLRQ
jgi:alkylation response protein AidB-like acyl-CoA dehydrogenase